MSSFSAHAFSAAIDTMALRQHRRYAGEFEMRDIETEASFVAGELSRLVSGGEYRFAPAELHHALTDGKVRTLFRSTALDSIVERVIAQFLSTSFENFLSPHVFSYRKGLAPRDALRAFSAFIRSHRQARPTSHTRGLYVLRRDVTSYGESIRVDSESKLWPLLERALFHADKSDSRIAIALLHQLLPREYLGIDGKGARLLVGTPTGSGIQPTLNNLYLAELDASLASLGFYARFGDDLLFASEDADIATQAGRLIDTHLKSLSLESKVQKAQNLDFNGAAKPRAAGFTATDSVDYLGMAISFRGTVGVRRDKWRILLRSIRKRMARSLAGSGALSPEARAQCVSAAVRTAFDARSALALSQAADLVDLVDDRSQLREFDNWLCRSAAELCTHVRGVRAFRLLPPRELYRLGLPSCVAARNRRHINAKAGS
ncbi:MAG: hypothetical protein IPK60_23820 [Sandaracinaceae bacterium]|nr:hypothetical protein [Sandaracinaceae bacterium]